MLIAALFRFWWLWLKRTGRVTRFDRIQWSSRTSKQMCRAFGVRVKVEGQLPEGGLVVFNHLSYLDIFLSSSIIPCIFISKQEVGSWPFLGLLARCAGTIFLNRASAAKAGSVLNQVDDCLRQRVPVVFFPEGTSTDGSSLLPFHPLFFEAAIRAGCGVTPVALGYRSSSLSENELAWYGNEEMLPNLLRMLGAGSLQARVIVGKTLEEVFDRKVAAAQSRDWVAAARENFKKAKTP